MHELFIVHLVFAIATVGCVLPIFCFYRQLRRRSRLLEQQIQIHQKLMEQAFTEIHNGPLQLLTFLMREVQVHEVTQQDLLKHLDDVYQDVRSGVQKLQQDHQSENR